jgi:hypothetical protein
MVETADYDPNIQVTLNREGTSVNREPGLTQAWMKENPNM